MTKTDLENKILSIVGVNNGLKGQELTLKLMSIDLDVNKNILLDSIFDMIERGDLVEIEYILTNGISKSFIVPKGTKVNVVNKVRVR